MRAPRLDGRCTQANSKFVERVCDGRLIVAYGQRELIRLLLNDFQEHTSDWLWETDESGVLVRVAERFAEAAGKTPTEPLYASFADVVGGFSEYRPPEVEDIF